MKTLSHDGDREDGRGLWVGCPALARVVSYHGRAFVEWGRARAVAHGVDTRVLVALYVVSVIPFYAGIALILYGSGIGTLRLGDLLRFDSSHLDLGNGTVIAGVLLNRLAWALPYLYIACFGRGLRWYVYGGLWLWISLTAFSLYR